MSSVFAVLLLVSLVALVWGLIAPHHLAKTAKVTRPVTRKHTGLIFGCLVIAFFALTAATSPPQAPPKQQKVNLTVTPTKSQPKTNTVTTKQITNTQSIAFTTTNQNDSNLPQGQTQIAQAGNNGVRTLTYVVTYTNGQQTSQKLIRSVVATQPVNQIDDVGTFVTTSNSAPVTSTLSAPSSPTPTPTPKSKPAPTTTPTPASKSSCAPLSDEDTCYESGEYCRDDDHGVSGIAGDGETITCENNDGWRWEP